VTWTAATETNLDFELGDFTGWDTTFFEAIDNWEAPAIYSTGEDGDSWRFASSTIASDSGLYRELSIPIHAAKIRVRIFAGSITSADQEDHGAALVYFRDSSGEAAGTVQICNIVSRNGTGDVVELFGEALVPSNAVTCAFYVMAIKGDEGATTQATVINTSVDWFIDSSFSRSYAQSALLEGGFDEATLTTWTNVGTQVEQRTGSYRYNYQGPYSLRGISGSGIRLRTTNQTISTIPTGTEEVIVSAFLGSDDDSHQARIILDWRDSGNSSLGTSQTNGIATKESVWNLIQTTTNLCGTYCQNIHTVPVGAESVIVTLEFEKSESHGALQAAIDSLSLVWSADSGLAQGVTDTYIAKGDGTWTLLTDRSSVFAGEGTTGLVPDPVSSSGRYLKDDGSWGTPASGGGGGTGGGTYSVNTLIEKIDVSGDTSVAFTGLDLTGYENIQIRFALRSNRAAAQDNLLIELNSGTSATDYWTESNRSVGGSSSGVSANFGLCGVISASDSETNSFGEGTITLINPNSTGKKTLNTAGGYNYDASAVKMSTYTSTTYVDSVTGAITDITLTPQNGPELTGTVWLYGEKEESIGSTPVRFDGGDANQVVSGSYDGGEAGSTYS